MTLKGFLLSAAFCVACQKEAPPAPVAPPTPEPAKPVVVAPKEPAPTAPAPAKEEEDDKSPQAWWTHSGDGTATLRQKPSAPGKCLVECKLGDGTTAWAAPATECFGEKADWRFVAKDCQRTVVMISAPSRAKSWRATEVMRVYKQGKLDYKVMGIVALPNEKLYKANRTWLRGCYGNPGEPPHYAKDAKSVEYETIDNKSSNVPLEK